MGWGPSLVPWPEKRPRQESWQHPAGRARGSQRGKGLASALALPTEDILSELVTSGMQPLVQDIKERFTSSPVSVRPSRLRGQTRARSPAAQARLPHATGLSVWFLPLFRDSMATPQRGGVISSAKK